VKLRVNITVDVHDSEYHSLSNAHGHINILSDLINDHTISDLTYMSRIVITNALTEATRPKEPTNDNP